ncbi:hypothetical protein AC578_6638 [Pseudocercospora eumusae]|uniref:Cytochrome P450 n=1 Tax=Pseudocercospora eumusae TaxID=321146 RepID=A0A139HG78_9PEZI|nr:hypothetical protein AC578_6638 [Pseudocercospora eumusae]
MLARCRISMPSFTKTYKSRADRKSPKKYLGMLTQRPGAQTNPDCTAERTISPHNADICGTIVPAGTDVSISKVLTAHDKTLYGPDAESIRPERWLEVDKARKAEMNRAAFAFAYGRRVCTGQHLAMIEVKKLIVSLIMSFKFEPVDGRWYERIHVRQSITPHQAGRSTHTEKKISACHPRYRILAACLNELVW